MILTTTVAGFIGTVAAIKGHDAKSLLPQIAAPTLVIAGANDAAVPQQAVRATGKIRWISQLKHYENAKKKKNPMNWTGPEIGRASCRERVGQKGSSRVRPA